ncbi:MAG: class I SAM-dependent methyltransferase [Acidobacteriota bacterium]
MTKKFNPAEVGRLESPERRRAMPPAGILRKIGLKRGMTFADVGAGTGFFSLPASRIVGPSGRVVALDVSKEMLEHLIAKGPPGWVETKICGEASLPLADGAADLVLACFVLHEAQDPVAFLRELGRVAKPRSPVVVMEWSKIRQKEGPPFEHRLHHHDVEALILQAGLCFRGMEFYNPSQYFAFAFRKEPA